MQEKILQITSGRGPVGCCWVVAQVLKMLLEEARQSGIDHAVLHREKATENGTLYSAVVKLQGKKLEEFLTGWLGTVQWIGQSRFRKFHKRKNWFVGVNLVNLPASKYTFREHDIRYEFTRSGGPGGQHVNKVNTAVRATHMPSGEVVFVAQGRSQLQNKQEAVRRLRNALQIKAFEKEKEQIKEGWQNHNNLDRGNPVKVFKGNDFKPNHQYKKYKSGRKRNKQEAFRGLDD